VGTTVDSAAMIDPPDGSLAGRLDRRFELFEAIVLAIAAVLTAWAAFQATKWSGVQADDYSRAAAARTESTRASTQVGQLTAVDADTFTSWVAALAAEQSNGQDSGLSPDGSYMPRPGTESAFLYAASVPSSEPPSTPGWQPPR
jgi:hypothetical protein